MSFKVKNHASVPSNPNSVRCSLHSSGKDRVNLANESPSGSSPLIIASTISGARVVSFRMRDT